MHYPKFPSNNYLPHRINIPRIDSSVVERKVYRYSCSALTCADNLVDLLTEIPDDQEVYILLDNVHLIEPEDEWQNISFLELLRFVNDYGMYYDRDRLRPKTFHRSNVRFILTTRVATGDIDARLASSARTIRMAASDTNPCRKFEYIEGTGGLDVLIQSDRSIVTVLGVSTKVGSGFIAPIKANNATDLFRFNNREAAAKSMSKLEELVSPRRMYENPSKSTVFVLEEWPIRLLGGQILQRLYNLLNLVNIRPAVGHFKFIHLCYSSEERDDHLWAFWSSIGALYKLRLGNPLIDSCLKASIGQKLGILLEANILPTDGDDARILSRLIKIFQLRYTDAVSSQRKIYASGLTSLMNIESGINRLQANQEENKRQLTEKRQEITNFIEAIDIKLKEAQIRNDKIDGFRQAQEKKTMDIAEKKQSIESNMSQVRARIELCKVDIDKCLRPEALNEIKSLRSPPKTIKDILDVLFMLLGEKELSWSSMKSYLTRYSLRDELTKYDFQNNLNINLLHDVEALIEQRQDSFNMQQATRASTSVVPIVKWIQATLEYGKVMIKLKPLNNQLAELQQERTEIEHKIANYRQEQQSLDVRIKGDTQRLDALREEQAQSESNYSRIEKELYDMRQVLRNLSCQRSRWKEKLKLIDELYGDMELMDLSILTAAILVTTYKCKADEDGSRNLYSRMVKLSALLGIESDPDETVQKLIDMSTGSISVDTERSCESRYSNEDLLNLFLVRTCLTATQCDELDLFPLIPFLEMDPKRPLKKDELAEYFSCQNIICGRDEIFYVDLESKSDNGDKLQTEDNSWMKSVRLGMQLNKVLVVDVSRLCETGEDLLDLMDIIIDCGRETDVDKSRQSSGVIFVGQWDVPAKLAEIEHFFLRILSSNKRNKPATASNTVEQISEQIVDQLVRYNNPELSQHCDQLFQEYLSRKSNSRLVELSLLEELTQVERVDLFGSNTSERGSDIHQSYVKMEVFLMKILNELHLIYVDLQACRSKWQADKDKLVAERSNYIGIARHAAEFYRHCLAGLSLMDPFYEISMERYTRLLLIESRSDTGRTINFREVLVEALRPMRPKARRDFTQNLLDSKRIVELLSNVTDFGKAKSLADSLVNSALRQASSLSTVLASLLDSKILSIAAGSSAANNHADSNVSSSSDNNIRLMVVQHDASKASPQLEVDAYFSELMVRRQNDADSNCQSDQPQRQTKARIEYAKFYATGEQPDQLKRLEMQIANLFVNNENIKGKQTDRPDSGCGRVCCICITNAHLAPCWVTNRLLACVQASLASGKLNRSKTKVLLLIISESGGCDGACATAKQSTLSQVKNNSNTMSSTSLDALYRHADVKYWHDELALNFADRYHLFMSTIGRRVLNRLEHKCSMGKGSKPQGGSISMNLVDELVRRVVILHTSCQQLTLAATLKHERSVWRRDYNFDHELLCFALGVFEHLVEALLNGRGLVRNEEIDLRHRLNKHLVEVVYGATHLETPEDEEFFSKLLDKLFGIPQDEIDQLLGSSSVEQRLIDFVG